MKKEDIPQDDSPLNKITKEVTENINQHMLPIADLVHTITLDNGKEFSLHELMATMLDAKIYFAKPYHSWERGLNENTNGLVRQYFPKKIPFEEVLSAACDKFGRMNTKNPALKPSAKNQLLKRCTVPRLRTR